MRSRLRGPYPWSKGPMESREVVHDAFRVNFTLRAGGSARMARPAQPEIALGIGPKWSRLSVEVVEPDHWRHTAGAAWWFRAVTWMCASILPPYQTRAGGDISRTDGSLNVQISSQIALFPRLLIPGRQPTAVGFKIPAPLTHYVPRVAIYDLPHSPLNPLKTRPPSPHSPPARFLEKSFTHFHQPVSRIVRVQKTTYDDV